MKIKFLKRLFVIAIFAVSCSDYAKLLESSDYELQYQTALQYYREGKTSKAINLFSNVMNIYAGTEKIDTIKFYFASSLFDRGDFTSSGPLFDDFRKSYSRSPFIERAEYLYAMSYYYDSPGSELDQSIAAKATAAFEEFIYRYPNSDMVERCMAYIVELEERKHKKDFYVGETYYKIGYHKSAITTLKNILKRDPDTPLREEILFMILKSNYAYAKESILEKQRERFYNVIDAYYSLTSQFPESKYSKIAKRLFEDAQAITEGKAMVSDFSQDVVLTHDKVYKKKERIEEKILAEEAKVGRKDDEKLAKLRKELEDIINEIEALERGELETETESSPEGEAVEREE